MPEIFLSYTHDDAEGAGRVEKALRDLGVEVWIDNRLETGARFTDHIHQQIDAADAVIVCWSKKAVESPWVQSEALFALERGKLTPVLLGNCELRPPFNTLNASNLVGWRGEARHAGWQRLLLALEKALDGVKLADRALVEELRIASKSVATPEAARRRRLIRTTIIAGVAIPALAATAAVGYVLMNTEAVIEEDRVARDRDREARAALDQEASAWETARDLRTREAILAFQQEYPDSDFFDDAALMLAEIDERATREMDAAEAAAFVARRWRETRDVDTIQAYRNFKLAFPGSPHVRDADAAIARLESGALEAADRDAWRNAEDADTITSYETYIDGADNDDYPGEHRERAEERIAELREAARRSADNARWQRATNATRSQAIREYRAYIAWAQENGGGYIARADDAIERLEREDRLIARARDLETSAAFQEYLDAFPSGHYASDARRDRDTYRRREQDAARRTAEDDAAFQRASRATVNRREALRRYLSGIYAQHREEAEDLIQEINQEDEAAWRRIGRETDSRRKRDLVRQYLDTYEDDSGRYVYEARRLLAQLDRTPTTTTVTGETGERETSPGTRPTTPRDTTPPTVTGGTAPGTTPTSSDPAVRAPSDTIEPETSAERAPD